MNITSIRSRQPQPQRVITIGDHCTAIRIERTESGSLQLQVLALEKPEDEAGNLVLFDIAPRSECAIYRPPITTVATLKIGGALLPIADAETADRVEAFLAGGDA